MAEKRKAIERDENDVDVKEGESKIQRKEDVKQRRSVRVEVRPENERFSRLLVILKEEEEWYDDENKRDKILIFVKSDEECDSLSSDLLKHGYSCLTLHDFDDGEPTISDFKNSTSSGNILIASSVAARSLDDVKDVQLVVNFHLPIRFGDYAYRAGHTDSSKGGCTITFLTSDDDIYVSHLCYDLEQSKVALVDVPHDLIAIGQKYLERTDEILYDDNNNINEKDDVDPFIFDKLNTPKITKIHGPPDYYEAQLEINDFPKYARRKVTHRTSIIPVIESTGVTIITLGAKAEPGGIPPRGCKKEYMSIQGPTQQSVTTAFAQLKLVLQKATSSSTRN